MASRTETVVAQSVSRRRVEIPSSVVREFLGSPESLPVIRDEMHEMLSAPDVSGSSPRTISEHVRASNLLSVVTGATRKSLSERRWISAREVPYTPVVYGRGGEQIDVTISTATSIFRTGGKGKLKSRAESQRLTFPLDKDKMIVDQPPVPASSIVAGCDMRIVFTACKLVPTDHFLDRLGARGRAAHIAYDAVQNLLKNNLTIDDKPSALGRMINAGKSKRVIDVTRHLRGGMSSTADVNYRTFSLKFELSIEFLTSFSVDEGDSVGKFVLRTVFTPVDGSSGVRPFSYAVVFTCNCTVKVSTNEKRKVMIIENAALDADGDGSQALPGAADMLAIPITLIDNGGDTVIRITQDGVAVDPGDVSLTEEVSAARFPGGARLLTITDSEASEGVVKAISAISDSVDGYTGILTKDMTPAAIAISKTGVERMHKGTRASDQLLRGSFLFECSLLHHLIANIRDPSLVSLKDVLKGPGAPGHFVASFEGGRVVMRRTHYNLLLSQDFIATTSRSSDGRVTSKQKRSETSGLGGFLIVESSSGRERVVFPTAYGHFAKVLLDTDAALGSETGPATRFFEPLDAVTRIRNGVRFLEEPLVDVICLMVGPARSARLDAARRYLQSTPFEDLDESIRLFAVRRAELGKSLRTVCERYFGNNGNLDVPSGFVTDHHRTAYAVNGREKMTRAMLNRCFVGEAFSTAGRFVIRPSKEGVRASKASFAVRTFPPGPDKGGEIPLFTTTLSHR